MTFLFLYFQTDDEIWIAGSLKEFGKLIGAIEDEKDKLLDRSYEQVRILTYRDSNPIIATRSLRA